MSAGLPDKVPTALLDNIYQGEPIRRFYTPECYHLRIDTRIQKKMNENERHKKNMNERLKALSEKINAGEVNTLKDYEYTGLSELGLIELAKWEKQNITGDDGGGHTDTVTRYRLKSAIDAEKRAIEDLARIELEAILAKNPQGDLSPSDFNRLIPETDKHKWEKQNKENEYGGRTEWITIYKLKSAAKGGKRKHCRGTKKAKRSRRKTKRRHH